MAEYIEREAVKALFDERYETAFVQERTRENKEHWRGVCAGLNWGRNTIADAPTADVVPKSEIEKIFAEIEDLLREWFDHFRQGGDIRESCAIMAALSQVTELKKKYTEENQNVNGN